MRLIAFGASLVVAFTLVYWLVMRAVTYFDGVVRITPIAAKVLIPLAQLYFAVLFLGLFLSVFGAYRALRQDQHYRDMSGAKRHHLRSLLAFVFSQRRYVAVFSISAVIYGVFFALVTSIIVYQPTLKFSEAYLATMPSIRLVPYYADLGQIPIMVVYLTENLGFLLIPLNLILLFAISFLVGVNFALFTFAYTTRARGTPSEGGRNWLGSLGAALGLFTGCPSCAGLFFAYTLGGATAMAVASALASLQVLFILLSVPVLVLTPVLIARMISHCKLPSRTPTQVR